MFEASTNETTQWFGQEFSGTGQRLIGWPSIRVLSDERGTARSAMVANADEPQIQSCAAEPVSLFQLVAGGNPPRRDDVRQIQEEVD